MVLEGKVAVVTGAGNGLGKQTALELAAHGAAVVVNDLGVHVDGSGSSDRALADGVADLIRQRGGRAVAHAGDVGSWTEARELIDSAVAEFGRLDIVVNSAGILRRGVTLDLTENDLDALVHVHLKGTVATMYHAGLHWRAAREADPTSSGSVINLTSRAGLQPRTPILTWYGAVKSAVALLSQASAAEFAEYGVRVNAIAPVGATRMADYTFDSGPALGFQEHDGALDDNNVPPVVAWLASDEAAEVSGEVFLVEGDTVSRYEPRQLSTTAGHSGRWDLSLVGREISRLIATP